MNNFIEEYQLVSKEDCNYIINWFEPQTNLHQPGLVGINPSVVDLKCKDSTDIHMDIRNQDDRVTDILMSAIEIAIKEYKEKYYWLDHVDPWNIFSGYNLQRYLPGQGYPATHSEQSGSGEQSNCLLVWTIYLNDVTDEGGTFFPYQRQLVSAKAGKVCLFPGPWTHMHRGVISPTQTKYIATGWFNYNS